MDATLDTVVAAAAAAVVLVAVVEIVIAAAPEYANRPASAHTLPNARMRLFA